MMIIEVDGDSHDYQGQYDERRTRFLEGRGYRLIRFTNDDVMKHQDGVLVVLAGAVSESPSPAATRHPLP